MSEISDDKGTSPNDLETRVNEIERRLELSDRLHKIEERLGGRHRDRVTTVLVGMAFGAFGLLVGVLVGLTTTEIVKPLIAALFAVFGGSLIAFLHKLTGPQQVRASIALCVMSITLLGGTLSGIRIRHARLLSPPDVTADYLRSDTIHACNEIDADYQNGRIELPVAYERMLSVCVLQRCEQVDSEYRNGHLELAAAYGMLYSACLGEDR